MMKLISIVGARPQFIKAAVVSRAIANYNQNHTDPSTRINEIILHTGQHYDSNMSQIFFDELAIPEPGYNLGVGSGRHGQMTGMMLARIEDVLIKEKPSCVLVYGDTNTTLAGALAASKLHLPLGHVEAGLRSYNRHMPEEINRILTDHISHFLFCPTETAVKNLEAEGIGGEGSLVRESLSSSPHSHEKTSTKTHQLTQIVSLVGDVMYDAFRFYKNLADKESSILRRLNVTKKNYCLATIHRAENTDNPERLENIFAAFGKLASSSCPFLVPIHPRTRRQLEALGIQGRSNHHVHIMEPVSYLDMVSLEQNAKVIFTDSGGVQKEAYFARVPCITLRDETEWVETVSDGCNRVVGTEINEIIKSYHEITDTDFRTSAFYYGDGHSGQKILEVLNSVLNQRR